ncbi:esterase, partial [Streptomyces lunaelactis]|nr:esterase [Streptomyces lunaelactis]
YSGVAYLCHDALCGISNQTLNSGLNTIATWLAANPNEVLTVFIEDYLPATVLQQELAAVPALAGLIFNPRTQGVQTQGWPKVSAMVTQNKRLLIFSDKPGREDFGVMFGQDWTVENHWSMGSPTGTSDWTCNTR